MNNLYESQNIPAAERNRLKSLGSDYLLYISTEALGENVKDKIVLDLGAGPSTALGKWVNKKGGHYIALDIQGTFLEEHAKKGHDVVQGNIEHLPYKPKTIDIAHTRLVLMHLSSEMRKQAVQEIIKVTKEKCLFLEPDWNSFLGSVVVNRLRDFALRFLTKRSDPYMGVKLKKEIELILSGTDLKIAETRFLREAGTDYDELIKIIASLKSLVEQTDPALIPEAEEIARAINEEAGKERPEAFKLPDFVLVSVTP